ncbi:replication initiation protein [Deltaproteobacteria bacterium TL4]
MKHLIKKHNNLIQARYTLTIPEQRILLYLLTLIHKDDESFKEYDIPIKTFVDEFQITAKNIHKTVDNITNEMMVRFITAPRGEGFVKFSWYSRVSYTPKQGVITIKIHEDMKPYLLELQSHFTKYDIRNIVKMQSSYQIRLFELLKMHQYKNKAFIVTVDTIREQFEIPNTYLFGDIKRQIIDKTQKFCLLNCDITFEYRLIKQGRKVHAFEFTVLDRQVVFDKQESFFNEQKLIADKWDTSWCALNDEAKRTKLLGKHNSNLLFVQGSTCCGQERN